MKFKTAVTGLALGAALAVSATAAVQAKELKFAFQGTLTSWDPYRLNETFTLGTMGNVYEGLIHRKPNMVIEPGLAVSWEIMEPTRWRFHLRKGVKFHNGNDFNADDVVFSATRVRAEGSDLKTRISADTKAIKVDDYTVDFVSDNPNPIIFSEWGTWNIIDKEWATANNAVTPQNVGGTEENYLTRHANGTGPFIMVSHEAGVKTTFKPNPNYWGKKQHNLTSVTYTPIGQDATRVAALLSGQVNMAYPVPVQDQARVNAASNASVLIGPELRTIFIGMDQFRDELLHSSVKGKNPLKDKRVREAVFHAIDIKAIQKKVMRNLSEPSSLMIAPSLTPISKDHYPRRAFDPAKSKSLLAAAGYPNGFEIDLDCPNDRYVNDEAICTAASAMLAKVGIKVKLLAQPKAKFFPKVLAPNLDYSMYLLGWTPGSLEAGNVLRDLFYCPRASKGEALWAKESRNKVGKGKFNIGGYCNPALDALTDKILSETNMKMRDEMITKAMGITVDDAAYVPLHQQALAWGVAKGVHVKQRGDNVFDWRYVMID
jgi:peptide/nickel transport system substrate-binding protein